MIKKILLLFLFILTVNIYSQQYNVEYQKIEGSLSSKDLTKNNFGRYDGYSMPMNENEAVYFIVFAEEFSPSLVLINPDGDLYQQVSAKGEDYASMGILVPKSGEWVLYVVGDSSSTGDYLLQYAFADSAALVVNQDVDFCTGLSYLFAHANAYFLFPQTFPTDDPLFQFKGSEDAFINGDDASYNAVFYQGDRKSKADESFNALLDNVSSCIAKNWKQKKGSETIEGTGKEKFVSWTEPVKNNPRFIKISLVDYSNEDSTTEYLNKYSVDLTILRY